MERITLATLHQATQQQVFDQAVIGIIEQGEPAFDLNAGMCAYRVGKLACAAGQLMSDREASGFRQTATYLSLLEEQHVPAAHYSLVRSLQCCHDHAATLMTNEVDPLFIDRFMTQVQNTARQYGLSMDAVNRALEAQLQPA